MAALAFNTVLDDNSLGFATHPLGSDHPDHSTQNECTQSYDQGGTAEIHPDMRGRRCKSRHGS